MLAHACTHLIVVVVPGVHDAGPRAARVCDDD